MNRDRKSRDLVLAPASTGDLGCFDACVKNRIIIFFFCVLKELTPNGVNCFGFRPMKRC